MKTLLNNYWSPVHLPPLILLLIIYIVPFSTFLSIWGAHGFGGLYLLSSFEEILLASGLSIGAYVALKDRKFVKQILSSKINQLIIGYSLLNLVYIIFASDTVQALIGVATNLRFLAIFILAQLGAYFWPKLPAKIEKALLATGFTVALIATVQIFLPFNALEYFGYDASGVNTPGVPPAYHFLSEGSTWLRAQATLRGPNALGAYLILPFCILLRSAINNKSRSALGLLALAIVSIAGVLTFSRSAWLGAGLGAAIIIWLSAGKNKKTIIALGILTVLLISAAALIFRGSPLIKSVVLHVGPTAQTESETSNEGHINNLKAAVADIAKHPLGGGPGSAGPVSGLSQSKPPKIAENYFLQIFQEIGWLGGLVFLLICAELGYRFWLARFERRGLIIFASFSGLILVNLLLHTWADEAVALSWWAFAGSNHKLLY